MMGLRKAEDVFRSCLGTCREQVHQHFAVRDYWPPLGQPYPDTGPRVYGEGWGPRLLVEMPDISTLEFWQEVRARPDAAFVQQRERVLGPGMQFAC